jgi:pimeloyl-ACP methyl ester carboxylesterase
MTTAVLLHGLGRCSFDWEGVPALVEHECITHDLPFHGGRPLDRPVAFDELVEDVLEVCDDVVDDLVIAGTSLGAAVALQCVALRPGRVRGLLLVAPLWYEGTSAAAYVSPVAKLGSIIRRRGLAFAWDVVQAVPPVSGWDEDDQAAYRARFLAYDVEATSTAIEQLARSRPQLQVDEVAAATTRVGVVGWTDDRVHPLACAEALARRLDAGLLRTRPQPIRRQEADDVLADALAAVVG